MSRCMCFSILRPGWVEMLRFVISASEASVDVSWLFVRGIDV